MPLTLHIAILVIIIIFVTLQVAFLYHFKKTLSRRVLAIIEKDRQQLS